jgi:hypothetical protein
MFASMNGAGTMSKDILMRLAGVWRGEGTGSYPDASPLRYVEETSILMEPDWSMAYVVQRTWRDNDGAKGRALHLEVGLILIGADGALQYGCAQDSGRTEVMKADLEPSVGGSTLIAWRTTAHSNDPRLVRLGRDWWLTGDTLRYKAYLSTVRSPEYRQHLEATLKRFSSAP